MKYLSGVAVLSLMLAAGIAADDSGATNGAREETRACVQCHSLRLIHSQRLSKATWTKEVDKMIRWGAPVHDRETLIDYLSEQYSDAKPAPEDSRSADGTKNSSMAPHDSRARGGN